MKRQPTTLHTFLLWAFVLALVGVAFGCWLVQGLGAAPLLPSRYRQMPEPMIEIVAPVDGTYLLIEHGPERDEIATRAYLYAGETARLPILIWDDTTEYHVQVYEGEPGEQARIYETRRYTGAWRVYGPMVGR
jgi:hypothetical protein